MKRAAFHIFLFFCCCTCSVHAQYVVDDPEVATVKIKSDTTLSFALYTPSGNTKDISTKPVFFFFEPWGNGSYPVLLYKELAKRYDMVLIGFYASRNGMNFDEAESKFNITFKELRDQYGLDPKKLCLVGFSGAGKVALKAVSVQSSIPYVIYGGATIEEYLSGKDILGFAGTQDMNYTDLLDYDNSLNIKTNIRHFIIEYDGPHSWFDDATMENAFEWFKLNLLRNQIIKQDPGFIQTMGSCYQRETDSLLKSNYWLRADNRVKRAQHFLEGLTDIKWLEDKQVMIEQSPYFKKEKKVQDQIIPQEKQTKKDYDTYFLDKDTSWWKTEISRLKKKDNDQQMQSNRRLLSYIGISCYYIAYDAFEQNSLNVAEKILEIYKLASPQNPEQAFLRAVLLAKKNNMARSEEAFEEAKRLGFIEWDKSPDETILQYYKRRNEK